jgi:hypothetical protein
MMFHAFLIKKKLIPSGPGALFPSKSQTTDFISSENGLSKVANDAG